ncbi:adenosylcobinamide-GDP ribazoletransferase [Clostridium ganghwense]|uniref:Adenosylcobinamide-GDP ribazoletransferase n=1 Tax=Clostridium ganghwense TaxID=312089 RepID=A0ABT4CVX0_9CLOT|nr:adenosylcobinamide-GDP ribazoletransferase [Clostridium ganghwense]MCY6372181.1 adenosylcobinamide-GDP ribazoletransferase [Clostridium ganghwense]
MGKYIKSFLLMLQFMTRIPININLPCEQEDFRRGTIFLPLVGAVIGLIQWLIYFVLIQRLPMTITAVFVVLTGVLLTGALHVDGLGDSCDGFFAFKGKDRIIEIMKDSRIGTYACIAVVFDILIKITSLSCINDTRTALIIIAVPIIGRASLVTISFIGNTAKKTGSGNLFIGNVGKIEISAALIIAAALVFLLVGIEKGSILIAASLILTFLFNKFCRSKIDGITGDNLGANNELNEILVLVLFIAMN